MIGAYYLKPDHLDRDQRRYILFGNEPMLLVESQELIWQTVKSYGFNEKIRFDIDDNFDWSPLIQECQSQPLFTKQRLIQCYISNFTKIRERFSDLIATMSDDVIIAASIGVVTKAQKNSKWWARLQEQTLVISHYELSPKEVKTWLLAKMKNIGIANEEELVSTLLYHNTGNLLALSQELEKLKLQYPNGKVNIKDYQAHLAQQSKYQPYHLVNAALDGSMEQIIKIYSSLQSSGIEALYLINTINKELKALTKIATNVVQAQPDLRGYNFFRNKEKNESLKKALRRHNRASLQKSILQLGRLERSAKGRGVYNTKAVWHGLLVLLLNLAGHKIWNP